MESLAKYVRWKQLVDWITNRVVSHKNKLIREANYTVMLRAVLLKRHMIDTWGINVLEKNIAKREEYCVKLSERWKFSGASTTFICPVNGWVEEWGPLHADPA